MLWANRNRLASAALFLSVLIVWVNPFDQAHAQAVAQNVSLTAPTEVLVGAPLEVSWSGSPDDRDFITILPFGADEGLLGAERPRVEDRNSLVLNAPSDPGLYEVRYVADAGRATLASAIVEVLDAAVEIAAPDEVWAGAAIELTWSMTVNPRDYLTIVPLASPSAETGNTMGANTDQAGTLQAPAVPGIYEIRYVLREGGRVLGAARIEVTQPAVTLTVASTAIMGAAFDVLWSARVHDNDYVTIVPFGTEAGVIGNSIRPRGEPPGQLTAPAEPGTYEVRYLLGEGLVTIATATIEVVEASVAITTLPRAIAGAPLEANWSMTINTNDLITVVPVGAAEGTIGNFATAGTRGTAILRAPQAVGEYEVRYVLNEGRETLARVPFEVLAAAPPVVQIDAPATVGPGDAISIGLAGEANGDDLRLTIARFNQPDFSWVSFANVALGGEAVEMVAPDDAGFYEIRFLDMENREVLGRMLLRVGLPETTPR